MKGKKLVGLLLVTVFVLSITVIVGRTKVKADSAGDTSLMVGNYTFYTANNLTGTNFNVTVNISNVTNMKGCSIKLGYNATLLHAIRVYTTAITATTTDWLPVDSHGVFHYDADPTINNTRTYAPDYAYVWVSAWGFTTFTGSGAVFTIKFQIIKAPPRETVTTPQNKSVSSALDLFETEVLDVYSSEIPHDEVDGLYSYTRPQILVTPPVAAFTWTPTYPSANQTVNFNASASIPNGGSIVSYAWNFSGVLRQYVVPTTTWKFNAIGNYSVTLNVTNSLGLWGTVSHVVQVTPKKPTAAFTWTPTYPSANQTVSFDASASTPNGGSIVSYAWDFNGDGIVDKTEVVPTTTWKYNAIRAYSVTLNVTDSEGLWGTVSHVVEVRPSTTLFVHPPVTTVSIGQTFKIGIIINNVINLSSFEFKLSYNTAILDTKNVWVMWPDFCIINETAGIIWVNASCPYPYPFSGSGAVAAITFTAVEPGICVLDLHNTTLIDFHGLPIAHVAVSGSVTVTLHDVAVVNIAPSVREAYQGHPVTVNVTALNNGTQQETFWVALYFNQTANGWTLIGNQTITDLNVGAEKTLTFVWNTTSVPVIRINNKYGNYTFKATAEVLPNEVNTKNNVLVGGAVGLRLLGDVNGDGKVTLADIGVLKLIYSGIIKPPYYPPYMPDINGDGKVTLADIGKLKLIYSSYV